MTSAASLSLLCHAGVEQIQHLIELDRCLSDRIANNVAVDARQPHCPRIGLSQRRGGNCVWVQALIE